MNLTNQRFLRQLLMIRYKTLLETLYTKTTLTERQKKDLQDRILNLQWIDKAFL
jgi:hypothetical protein